MKKVLFSMVLLVFSVTMNAQENEVKRTVFSNFHFELKALYGTKQHGMSPLSANMQLSYEFANRWSLQATAEACHTLFKADDKKWWTKDISLGGGLAYAWYEGKGERFDVRLQVLNTVGSPDRKYTTFDIGTTWYGHSSKQALAPVLGIGFRHQKSHTDGVSNWSGIYGTIGVRF